MEKIKNLMKIIRETNVEFVDFRFTDFDGKWCHVSFIADKVNEEFLNSGLSFDGSSIPGWKEINNSDMLLMPDLESFFMDPFVSSPTMIVICDVVELDGKPYNKDPRSLSKRALNFFKNSGIGDKAFFGPEFEFFIFDDVRFKNSSSEAFAIVDSKEMPENSAKKYENGNLAFRNQEKKSYFSSQPSDMFHCIRAEILTMIKNVGLFPSLHHHEVANSQQEIGFDFDDLLKTSDNVQMIKYLIHNVAASFGKTATFMPKPIMKDNGSGMHVHQSLWKNDKPLFAGDKYSGLSQDCLFYIGGIIKHAKAINAFSNASTNSYKRLVPGYEAPVILAYSAFNRSASIRVPHANTAKAKRIEVRFPDATANPYLAFSAMLMAGIDGIKNKIDPGEAASKNLYELEESEMQNYKTVAKSFTEALDSLDKDREFLKEGGVFNDCLIDSYIKLKREEIDFIDNSICPAEFLMYYGR